MVLRSFPVVYTYFLGCGDTDPSEVRTRIAAASVHHCKLLLRWEFGVHLRFFGTYTRLVFTRELRLHE
jgi:hypothetical protein